MAAEIKKLAALIRERSTELLDRWRLLVRELPGARELDVPTLNDHIPTLIDELAAALDANSDETIPEALAQGTPPAHGSQRLADGFDIEEVVAEYNILRGCIHDLAGRHGVQLQGPPFHILNRVLDGAIGLAVQTYATARALLVQKRREEYLAFVAHDLRTPLNAISLGTFLLEHSVGGETHNVELARALQTLRRNVKHMESLVTEVLKENSALLTETGLKLERRTFDLWPLVQSLIQDLRQVADTNGTQLINAVPFDLTIHADASVLRRVFQNLIANAISYAPEAEVKIGAKTLADGTSVECWVEDTGAGIPDELRGRVFEKLETDPEKSGGMGLGLAIVKAFVEAHGGTISVTSELGHGARFQFDVPA